MEPISHFFCYKTEQEKKTMSRDAAKDFPEVMIFFTAIKCLVAY